MNGASVRRVVVTTAGVALETAACPATGADEARVELIAAGICGSDLHAVRGHHPFVSLPYHPGHEVVGVVVELGSDVDTVRIGDRVVVEPTLPCWRCKMCTSDRQNLCENLRFFGCVHPQGGMAEAFTIPANRLHVVPDDLDDRAAALIEPLATPLHALRLAGPLADRTVAILGAGTIGLLLLSAVRDQQPARVLVTDLRPDKRERALRLGADAVLDAADPELAASIRAGLGESADVVFDCVAVQSTVSTAIAAADKGGTAVIVGVPTAPVEIPLPLIQDHQIRLQGSATYLPVDVAASIAALRSGLVDVDEIVTSIYPFERAPEAFQAAAGGAEVKVLITTGRAADPVG